MLIKEENMRRFVIVAVLVVMLAIPMANAFAEEPQVVEQYPDGWWLLGEVWWTPAWLGFPPFPWFPGEPVNAYMYRPATAWWDPIFYEWVPMGWPLTLQGPIMGSWWWGEPVNGVVPIGMPDDPDLIAFNDSEQRRMSFAEDWKFANEWGGYYAEFMLPRDEVWFPCSYPLKWKCNYEIAPFVFEYHSPAVMAYECMWVNPWTLECLDWPWIVAPYDTISPVVIEIFNDQSPLPFGYWFELEIAGYFWKFTDIP
jgi:hypothetical protein